MAAKWEAGKWVQHAPLDLGSQDQPQRSYEVCTRACSNFTTELIHPEDDVWCGCVLCLSVCQCSSLCAERSAGTAAFPMPSWCCGLLRLLTGDSCSKADGQLEWCWDHFAGIIFTVTKILSQKSYSFPRFVLDYCSDTQYIKRICFLLWLAFTLANAAGFELSSPELTPLCCCCVSSRLQQASILWFSTEGSCNKFPFPLSLPLRFAHCILLCVSSWKGVALWCLGLLK